MTFVDRYFGKSLRDGITEADLRTMIANNPDESLNLEYKHPDKLKKPNDLVKVLSSFANSEGGLLIVGVDEKRVGTSSRGIELISDSGYTKEWFEQAIVNRMHPLASGIVVSRVVSSKGWVFLVDVPASMNPPHMSVDNKYYYRANFSVNPMEHYQVADAFGKRLRPELVPALEISSFKSGNDWLKMRYGFENVGHSSAKWASIHIHFVDCEISHPTVIEAEFGELSTNSLGGKDYSIDYGPDQRAVHPSMEFLIRQPRNLRVTISPTIAHITIGAEGATTDRYITILGHSWMADKTSQCGSEHWIRLPVYKLSETFLQSNLAEWLGVNFGLDILKMRSNDPRLFILSLPDGREVSASEAFEETRGKFSVRAHL